jgi:hypothetical protein
MKLSLAFTGSFSDGWNDGLQARPRSCEVVPYRVRNSEFMRQTGPVLWGNHKVPVPSDA